MDILQTFIFDDTDIRGAVVKIDDSFKSMIESHDYRPSVQEILGQTIAANILVTSHLKFDGTISIQAKGEGSIALLASECNDKLQYRAVACETEAASGESFSQTFAGGVLAITMEPDKGQRYQSMVPLSHPQLADCLAEYFVQSEQLPTWFYLDGTSTASVGLMLQALPPQVCLDDEKRKEDWERLVHLAATTTTQELIGLAPEDMLYRLFHEEDIRVFEPRPVAFFCSCSVERMERALLTLGKEELMDILEEQGEIKTQCHFCNKEYQFHRSEVLQLIQAGQLGSLN